REAFDFRQRRLSSPGDLEGAISDLRSGQVPDALSEHELAVVMDPGFDEVAVELPGHAGRLLLEPLQVFVAPPVVQPALRVELRPFVVEAVADLVADDDADGSVVDGVAGVHGERG